MNPLVIRDKKVGEMNESLSYQRQKKWERWINQLSIKSFLGTGNTNSISRRAISEAIWNYSLCIHLPFEEQLLFEFDLLEEINNQLQCLKKNLYEDQSDKSAGLNVLF